MNNKFISKYKLSILLFFFSLFHVNAQEWLPWSSWQESKIGEELEYRQRLKYTTCDTYALQIEWKNHLPQEIELKFEVRDHRNIKEIKVVEIPVGETVSLYGGTGFKSNKIKIRVLELKFLAKNDN